MKTKSMIDKFTSIPISGEQLAGDLRSAMADAEELLRATTTQAGEGAAAVRACIQENLQVVKESMVAAEAVVIERTRQAEKATDHYIHDNVWSWR